MTADEQKKAAAIAALEYVKTGMKVGLGTGSTANHFIAALADKVKTENLDIECVASSRTSFQLASKLGLKMTTLEKQPRLDITVDGTDEFDGKFQLIKGGGGALLIEKIVASSSRYMIVIADQSKKVETLGKFPLPVEVVPFGINATAWKHISTRRKAGGHRAAGHQHFDALWSIAQQQHGRSSQKTWGFFVGVEELGRSDHGTIMWRLVLTLA